MADSNAYCVSKSQTKNDDAIKGEDLVSLGVIDTNAISCKPREYSELLLLIYNVA